MKDVPDEDVKNYLLATSDFCTGMQDDINVYVTRDRLNNESFRQKLNPIAKNIFRSQNPLELVFKDISICAAQNPIIASLIKELDLGKKDITSTLIKKVPNSVDVEIQSRLNALKDNKGKFNSNNNYAPPQPPPSPPFFNCLNRLCRPVD